MTISSRLARLERAVPVAESSAEWDMTLEEFHQVICWWFRPPHRLKFAGGQVVAERWPGAGPDEYEALVEFAQILNRASVRHSGVVLYLLTQREIDALLAEIGAGRIFLEHSFGRGDGHSSDVRMTCDPSDPYYWRLQRLVDACNVAQDAFVQQTGSARPQNGQEVVEWLQMVRDALRDEFEGQLEQTAATGPGP
jgi:hypothetical protein